MRQADEGACRHLGHIGVIEATAWMSIAPTRSRNALRLSGSWIAAAIPITILSWLSESASGMVPRLYHNL